MTPCFAPPTNSSGRENERRPSYRASSRGLRRNGDHLIVRRMGNTSAAKNQLIAAGLLSAATIIWLYGLIPYTYSHLPGNQLTTGFGALWLMWNRDQEFQHGMLVPLICGFLVYVKRKDLAKLPIRGSLWGGLAVGFGLLVYWAGRRVDNQYLGFFSLHILITGLVLWFLGWRWLIATIFPLTFLVFAWPMPFLDNLLAFPLRMIMSHSSVAALNFLGVNAVQQGTAIISAAAPGMGPVGAQRFAVDVADPCSGIRSLFALMMVSALFGYFTQRTLWKQLVLFACSIPLAILGNLFRILLLTFGTMILGPDIAIGPIEHPSLYHTISGFFVFIVALAGMVGAGKLLEHGPAALCASARTRLTRSTDADRFSTDTLNDDRISDIY